jgi:hypothetical protein
MKLKKQCILIFSGLLLTPLFVSFTTSCRHQTESITIDSSSGEQLYKGVTLTYTFKNVTASDHITIESDYDDALPTHKSYIHIEVNNLSATITRTDKSLASGDSQECVLKFCNNNDLFDQRTILLLDDQ